MDLKTYFKEKHSTQQNVAAELGVSQGLVSHWTVGREKVTPEKVLPLYFITGCRVTPHEARPDLYPDPAWVPDAEMRKAATA